MFPMQKKGNNMSLSRHLFSTPIDLATAQGHIYDALIVGAGPAGSSAAYHLAASGVDVLLVDRASFPRTKACGDAIMPPALVELERMGVADEVRHRFTQANHIGMWVQGMSPGMHPVGKAGEGEHAWVAPRADFDAFLCEHALRQGATWLDSMTVHDVLVGTDVARVHGSRDHHEVTLKAQLVIAADGSGSRIARRVRERVREQMMGGDPAIAPALTLPQDDRARLTAIRGYVAGIRGLSDALEFYFREDGTTYYWVFPVGGGLANVGVLASMAQLRSRKTDLKRSLVAFLHAPELEGRAAHIYVAGPLSAAPIHAGLRGTALFDDRLLCVGDAAALVDPNSAEGISAALWSGRRAAETTLSALQKNDVSRQFLSRYGSAVYARYLARYEALLSQ
jgi:geranylgeranyl reductase family protein